MAVVWGGFAAAKEKWQVDLTAGAAIRIATCKLQVMAIVTPVVGLCWVLHC
jgi:hypothetical protein